MPIHASQRPAETADIDFASLNLTYLPSFKPEFVIAKTGWSPPPSVSPNLPFAVMQLLLHSCANVMTFISLSG